MREEVEPRSKTCLFVQLFRRRFNVSTISKRRRYVKSTSSTSKLHIGFSSQTTIIAAPTFCFHKWHRTCFTICSSDPETPGKFDDRRLFDASCRLVSSLTKSATLTQYYGPRRRTYFPGVFYCADRCINCLSDNCLTLSFAWRQSSGAEERSPPRLEGLLINSLSTTAAFAVNDIPRGSK